jgi:DNA repair protein RadC
VEQLFIPVYRVALVREGEQPVSSKRLTTPEEVAATVRQYLHEPDREVVVALMLSTKQEIIVINTVSIGILDQSLVHPREVFKPALLMNAAAIILAHNHPSGDTTPSVEDRTVSLRIAEAGKVLGVELLDHLIIGPKAFTSLRATGAL